MQNVIAHNKEVYNKIAKHFSDTRSYIWDDLIALADYINPGDRVLDLACGNGRLYQLIEKKSTPEKPVTYLGVDFSEELLNKARENWAEAEFSLGTMTDIPCEDNEFDIIFCLAAFHHLPDNDSRKKAIAEMKRVLKPGGRLIMTNWNLYNDWVKEKIKEDKFEVDSIDSRHIKIPWRSGDKKLWGWRHYWSFTMQELQELFEMTGFIVQEQYFTADKTGRTDIQKGMNIVTVCKKSK